jgi:hypothetical protein
VLEVSDEALVVATGSAPVALGRLRDVFGAPVPPAAVAAVGEVLPALEPERAEALSRAIAAAIPGERHWRDRLRRFEPAVLPEARGAAAAGASFARRPLALPAGLARERLLAAVGAFAARMSGKACVDLAYRDASVAQAAEAAPGYVSGWAPVRFGEASDFGAAARAFDEELARARRFGASPSISSRAIPRSRRRPRRMSGSPSAAALSPSRGPA